VNLKAASTAFRNFHDQGWEIAALGYASLAMT